MAVTQEDLEQIRAYLIAHSTDVTDLNEASSVTDGDISLPAVNTTSHEMVSVPLSLIREYVASQVGSVNQARNAALSAAAGANQSKARIDEILNAIGATQELAGEVIDNLDEEIMRVFTPISQTQYDALVDAGTVDANKFYFIYEEE